MYFFSLKGNYCERGSSFETPCPAGTYGAAELLKSESECTLCDPGEYCGSDGLPSPSGGCTPGK